MEYTIRGAVNASFDRAVEATIDALGDEVFNRVLAAAAEVLRKAAEA